MSWNDLYSVPFRLLAFLWHLTYEHAKQNPWATGVALYGLARAFGVVIQSGQRGVLFRWGRVIKELEPGFHWLVPIVHGVRITHVRSITIDIPAQKVMTADGLVYDVGVNAVYRVADPTKALTLVDHIDAGCRNAIPIIVTDIFRVRDQAELVDRASLDQALSDRTNAWVARWGLVIEQAGFTTIAPSRDVLRTTQLRSKTMERAQALRALMADGLDAHSALIMIGTDHKPITESSVPYHPPQRKLGRSKGTRFQKKKKASLLPVPTTKTADPAIPVDPKAEAKSKNKGKKHSKAKPKTPTH